MARLQQAGIEIDLLPGWEGRIFTRNAAGERLTVPQGTPQRAPGAVFGSSGPILHAASFALPSNAGDFGSGAVESMSNNDVFVALVDHGSSAAGTALFARRGIPRPILSSQFDPLRLQRPLAGQSGLQSFFTAGGRGFCLYVVLGAHLFRGRLARIANEALRTLQIS